MIAISYKYFSYLFPPKSSIINHQLCRKNWLHDVFIFRLFVYLITALEKDGFGEYKNYECFVAEITVNGEGKYS